MKTLVILAHPDMENSRINKKWKEELEKYNITDLSELFIVEYSGDGKLFIVKK